jgi:hypothetical protein
VLENLLSAVGGAELPPAVSSILSTSPFQFYLTGSRFFGSHRQESDYDFFTDLKPGLTDWLVLHGFIKDSSPDYNSVDIIQTWKHCVMTVDIQIVVDAALKSKIQDLMRADPLRSMMGKVSKEELRALWQFALSAVAVGRNMALAQTTAGR